MSAAEETEREDLNIEDLLDSTGSTNTEWTQGKNTKFVGEVIRVKAYKRGNGTEKEKYGLIISKLSLNDRDFESWRTKPPSFGALKKHFADLKSKYIAKSASDREGANLSGLDEEKSNLDRMLEAVCNELDSTTKDKVAKSKKEQARSKSMLTHKKSLLKNGSLLSTTRFRTCAPPAVKLPLRRSAQPFLRH